jgi:hypothetical protein
MENNELELSLLDGIHEDDHEKIILLKKSVSFNPLIDERIIEVNDYSTISTSSSSSSLSEDFYNIKNIKKINVNQLIIENKHLIYFGCSSIIIGAFIKYFI